MGGRTAQAAVRVDAGVSLLDGARSLLVVGFFQEALRAPGYLRPRRGVRRGRRRRALRSRVEPRRLAGGARRAHRPGADASLGTTDQAAYAGISASVRKIFSSGMWIAVAGGYSREFDHLTYTGSAVSYDTASAPTFAATLFYAVPIGGPGGPRP